MSQAALAEPINQELSDLIDSKFREVREGTIVKGTILEIRPQVVLVDIGYKSEGAIPNNEFEDDEIDTFLGMNDQIVILSAATALDAIAANQVMVLKVITIMDLRTDGAAVAQELRQQASGLRKTYTDLETDGVIDWAEFADTDFARRERVIKQSLRGG